MTPFDRLRRAIVERAASQWVALGVLLEGEPDDTIIDLEALIAVTAEFGHADVRLLDGATDWCASFGTYVNGARLRTVANEMRIDPARMGEFSATVATAGGPSWPGLTAPRAGYENRENVEVRDLREPSRLLWRLRAAFGVNAHADLVAVLAARSDSELSVAEIARRTRFSKRNIAVTVDALRLARVVEVRRVGNENRVRMARDRALLGWIGQPRVAAVDWVARYAVGVAVLALADRYIAGTPAVRAIEGRSLVSRLSTDISEGSLPEPDLAPLGPAFADSFERWVEALAEVFDSRSVVPPRPS